MHKRFFSGFIYLIFVMQTSLAQESQETHDHNPCREKPGSTCLNNFIDTQVEQLNESNPKYNLIHTHWRFEETHNKKKYSKNTTTAPPPEIRINQQLTAEEKFLFSLRNSNFQQALKQAQSHPEPMQDANSLYPHSLLISRLILTVQDSEADNVKRDLLDTLMKSSDDDFIKAITEVARIEIISGAPNKGVNTMNRAHIDGFSDTLILHEKQFTQSISALSTSLFLDPTYTESRCSNKSTAAGQAITALLNGQSIKLLETIDQTPSPTLRTKLQLNLLGLHINAESCPIVIDFLTKLLIQNEIELYISQKKDLLSLIYFSRSLRRHFEK